ncbi:C6 zinc finger domain protein [Aspergillus sclerotioniger CBS 115572]|uniref:C6 zinc finger domain protein n=1 Tax=Aspergillus sclerotioniger CBS 115572 TaxID=1450535 RepID=A0A317VIW6_9EURO|nr:C6 zinc finger domain protein [Aspergillus sclerotioniger CBS 115572]PWY73885.1 C6 zinc finger domain protein [Aspergillus sclerotioniger CBS 115572]
MQVPTVIDRTRHRDRTILTQSRELDLRAISMSGNALGTLCTFNGLPFFSPTGQQWIKSRTGEDVNLAHMSPKPSTSNQVTSTGVPHSVALPEKEVVIQLLDEWGPSILSRLFPFINRELLEFTIKAAYHDEVSVSSPGADSARACIHAFTAVCLSSSIYRGHEVMHAEDHVHAAYKLLPGLLIELVTLDGLQTVLMLCLCSLVVTGNIFYLEMLLATSSRFVFHLNGHLAPVYINDDLQFKTKLHTRTLFWICYITDKEFSLRTGHPPCLDETHCDLTLPDIQQTTQEFLTCIRLAILLSQVYHGLYSMKALHGTDNQLLGTIRDLDNALETWRMSIPARNRPRLIDRETDVISTPNTLIQLQYLYCMAMIHHASGKCSVWVQNHDTSEAGSSLAISVEASRSMLQKFLDDCFHFDKNNLRYAHVVFSSTFQTAKLRRRFCLPYFLTAICHLFSNILLNPLDEGSDDDLDLIRSVPTHIRDRLPPEIPRLSSHQVKLFEDFVMELGRLASSAVNKAQELFEANN